MYVVISYGVKYQTGNKSVHAKYQRLPEEQPCAHLAAATQMGLKDEKEQETKEEHGPGKYGDNIKALLLVKR